MDLPFGFNSNIKYLYTRLVGESRGSAGSILEEMQQKGLFEALKDYYGEELLRIFIFIFNLFLQEEILQRVKRMKINNSVENMNKHNKDINELLQVIQVNSLKKNS